jgi:spermidine/putrescine-binding protein
MTATVTVWAGTTQISKKVKTAKAAAKFINEMHRNAYSPSITAEDGTDLTLETVTSGSKSFSVFVNAETGECY